MSTAIAMLAVGLMSYVFRVVPLLTVGRLRPGPSVLRTIRHGGAAAVTALFVTSLGGGAHGSVDPALIIAAGVSLWVAVRGAADAAHRAIRRCGIRAGRRGPAAGAGGQLVAVDRPPRLWGRGELVTVRSEPPASWPKVWSAPESVRWGYLNLGH